MTDDGRWLEVGALEKRDYGPVFEAVDAGAALALGAKSVMLIQKNNGTPTTYSAERLLTTSSNAAGMRYSTSRLFHQVLIDETGGEFFRFSIALAAARDSWFRRRSRRQYWNPAVDVFSLWPNPGPADAWQDAD